MFRFIFPIILLFFAASLYFDYIKPSALRIEVLSEDIKKMDVALDTQKADIEKALAELKKDKDSIDLKDIEKLDRLVPKQNDFDEAVFVNDMNNIAIKHGMVIKNMQLSNQSSATNDTNNTENAGGSDDTDNADSSDDIKGDYGTFKLQFSVDSTYKEFIKFMKAIERNEQLMDVNITSFQGTDEGDYSYRVALTAYWLK